MTAAGKYAALPAGDPSGVWDWADSFSRATQRRWAMSELRERIAKLGASCGDCQFWMKSRECPREHNVGGLSRGPSCSAIPCPKFQITASAVDLRAQLQVELAALADGALPRHEPDDGSALVLNDLNPNPDSSNQKPECR